MECQKVSSGRVDLHSGDGFRAPWYEAFAVASAEEQANHDDEDEPDTTSSNLESAQRAVPSHNAIQIDRRGWSIDPRVHQRSLKLLSMSIGLLGEPCVLLLGEPCVVAEAAFEA